MGGIKYYVYYVAATHQDEKTSPHTDTSTAATALTTATATPWLIFAAAATADHYHHMWCGNSGTMAPCYAIWGALVTPDFRGIL